MNRQAVDNYSRVDMFLYFNVIAQACMRSVIKWVYKAKLVLAVTTIGVLTNTLHKEPAA